MSARLSLHLGDDMERGVKKKKPDKKKNPGFLDNVDGTLMEARGWSIKSNFYTRHLIGCLHVMTLDPALNRTQPKIAVNGYSASVDFIRVFVIEWEIIQAIYSSSHCKFF